MTGSAKGSRQSGITIAVIVVLIVPLLAAGVWVFAASSESPLESAALVAPLIATVESATRTESADVAIAVVPGVAFSPSTQASGTLTEFGVEPGDKVNNKDVLMTVDAKSVLAYTSEQPLYRDVTRSATGADVKTAQQLLIDLGFLEGKADGKAGNATEQAVKAFNLEYGYGKNNPVLSRSSLVWIGESPVTVSEVNIAAGDTVSPGTEVFATTSAVAGIAVTETPSIPRDGVLELVADDITVPYVAGSEQVTDPDAVAAIAAMLGSVTESVATVRLAEPVTVGTVPSSAIVEDSNGMACMFPSVGGAAVVVVPTGGTLGTVDLDPKLISDPVLVNPREVRGDLSCG
ncbi:peptidoglycan-binding domain-containing protein [Demequina aurantiaca]|uniref:peptidoglycan-binding domain-containing protein n=1 Tax=Demequina aurantiaca TaxID=676200 RepID=UPI003D32FA0E